MAIKIYDIAFTKTAKNEMKRVHNYIEKKLHNKYAADLLMQQIEKKVYEISYAPHSYAQINKMGALRRRYRRALVKNFILLYTIDEEKNIILISHLYHARQNYLK